MAMALVGAVAGARSQPDAVGVRGSVSNHEGTPVAEGTVTLQSSDRSSIVTASLDQSGRFQIVPTGAGRHRLTILAPGYASRLVDVIVPASRTIALPALLLEAPAYFRARFVNGDGDVIVSPVIRLRSVGVDGVSFPGAGVDGSSRVDADGSITIGPLPNGITTMALDMPGLAQTRLPDITVRGHQGRHDGGTIVIRPVRCCALRSSIATAHLSRITPSRSKMCGRIRPWRSGRCGPITSGARRSTDSAPAATSSARR